MKPPVVVRALRDEERQALEAGLRSRDAFVLRRCQILLASAAGKPVKEIAANLGCATQSVRDILHAFNQGGIPETLVRKSNRPKSARPILDEVGREQFQALLEQGPRAFGKERSTWTLELAAQVAREQGLTGDKQLSIETIRTALKRLDIHWKRAKSWIASPDAAYARKKSDETS